MNNLFTLGHEHKINKLIDCIDGRNHLIMELSTYGEHIG